MYAQACEWVPSNQASKSVLGQDLLLKTNCTSARHLGWFWHAFAPRYLLVLSWIPYSFGRSPDVHLVRFVRHAEFPHFIEHALFTLITASNDPSAHEMSPGATFAV